MSIAETASPAATTIHANAWLAAAPAPPSALWPSLIAAWTRRLDRRIEDDLRWLDHAGVREDFRSASRD
jgi:hypothetical protein